MVWITAPPPTPLGVLLKCPKFCNLMCARRSACHRPEERHVLPSGSLPQDVHPPWEEECLSCVQPPRTGASLGHHCQHCQSGLAWRGHYDILSAQPQTNPKSNIDSKPTPFIHHDTESIISRLPDSRTLNPYPSPIPSLLRPKP